MRFLGVIFVFFGYVLVYASTAAGGKFATEPWAGLFADAYTDTGMTNQQWANIANQTLPGNNFTPLSASPNFTSTTPVTQRRGLNYSTPGHQGT